jgi:hypothetical protein
MYIEIKLLAIDASFCIFKDKNRSRKRLYELEKVFLRAVPIS